MDFVKLSHIVAIDREWGIGKENKIPWHISADLKYFKETTLDHCVIMGRKTFDSLGKPLSRRTNIVVTRRGHSIIPGIYTFNNLAKAIDFGKENEKSELFIIGGGEIFKETLHLINRVYLTKIDQSFNCDTFYPRLDLQEWKMISERIPENSGEKEKSDLPFFSFQVWERVNQ